MTDKATKKEVVEKVQNYKTLSEEQRKKFIATLTVKGWQEEKNKYSYMYGGFNYFIQDLQKFGKPELKKQVEEDMIKARELKKEQEEQSKVKKAEKAKKKELEKRGAPLDLQSSWQDFNFVLSRKLSALKGSDELYEKLDQVFVEILQLEEDNYYLLNEEEIKKEAEEEIKEAKEKLKKIEEMKKKYKIS